MDLDFQPPKPANQPPSPAFTPTPSDATTPVPPISQAPTEEPKQVAPVPPLPPFPEPPARKRSRLPLLLGVLTLAAGAAVVVLVVVPLINQPSQPQPTPPPSSLLPAPSPQPLPSPTTPAGRDAQRKQDIQKIGELLAAYLADSQSYPVVPSKEKLNNSSSITVKALVPKYAANLPVDPIDPDYWYGYLSGDGKSYELSARLEDSSDPQAQLVGSKYLYFLKK